MSIAEIVESVVAGPLPLRLVAYDGSALGPADARPGPAPAHAPRRGVPRHGARRARAGPGLRRRRPLSRACTPATPTTCSSTSPTCSSSARPRRPRSRWRAPSGVKGLTPPPPPPQESLPRWRRVAEGLRHSKTRDAGAISHHYDVSNRFYEMVLGPSMTYTCACYPDAAATLEQAQENKYRPGLRQARAASRATGCSTSAAAGAAWSATRPAHGVQVLGVTLSRQQAEWAQKAIADEGLADLAEVRHCDYRDVTETGFDAVSSIGLTEHIGVRNYPAYFAWIRDRLRPGGLLLNHCITRPHNRRQETGHFIDRYVFPDGELTGSGRIISEAQDDGLEVRARGEPARALRAHPARVVPQPRRPLGRVRRRGR